MSVSRIGEREREYVLEVLDSQFRTSSCGHMNQRLEKAFAHRFSRRFAIAFVNGTATLHAALVAAGVGRGDEVIVPPLTMSSTSFAVLQAGATPVFADIDPLTWTISPESVLKGLSERTKAIIPVALYGLAPDLDRLMDISKQHDLFLLEDDAQCFLGYCHGRIVGSVGHASSFSFQSSKHMTSGEGGMVITDDERLADRIRAFNSLGYAAVRANQGKITKETIQDPQYERHASVGYNYRMPELCAAVALAQLERLDELVEIRTRAAKAYAQAAEGCSWLIPQSVQDGFKHAYWTYVLKLSPDVPFSWYDFRQKYVELGGDGMYAAWQLTYLEPALRGVRFSSDQSQDYGPGLCPVAESIQPYLLQLKTNYFTEDSILHQAEMLAATILYFSHKG